MKSAIPPIGGLFLSLSLALVLACTSGESLAADDTLTRGAYVFQAAGCVGCHTDLPKKGPRLAGGRAFKTPFGTFYSPNITPHPEYGIGAWTEADFLRALRDGVGPGGSHYFPVFPYTSYTKMTDSDARALWAYLRDQDPWDRANRDHEVSFPFGWRFLMTFWKLLFFDAGAFQPDASKDAAWNRGAYLVNALGHCGECHTPRNPFGAVDSDMYLAGTTEGPEGDKVPNITPDPETGLGKWSAEDLDGLLSLGMTPDADFVGSSMGEVIENTTGKLTSEDRAAMIAYLRSLPPIRHDLRKKKNGNQ